jgi:ribokinase
MQNETNLTATVAQLCGDKGVALALNPSPMEEGLLRNFPFHVVRWFLINQGEGRALTGETDPEAIVKILTDRYPKAAVVLTCGEHGVLFREGDWRQTYPAFSVPVVDTTAAGDTFTGFFLGRLAANRPVPESLRVATAAAALAVSRHGAAASIPTLNEALELAGYIDWVP